MFSLLLASFMTVSRYAKPTPASSAGGGHFREDQLGNKARFFGL